MTLRRRLRTIVITSVLVTGGIAAAPVALGNAAAAKAPAIHDDPLAPVAQHALGTLAQLADAGTRASWSSYEADRRQLAVSVAGRLGLDPTALETAWSSADLAHQAALMGAFSQLGTPYRTNRSEPGVGFDCSGLTTYAWAQAGVSLPRQSGSQINTIATRTADTAQAGDIAYYPGHAMMWLGIDTAIVHAPYTGRTVEVDFATKKHRLRYGNPLG